MWLVQDRAGRSTELSRQSPVGVAPGPDGLSLIVGQDEVGWYGGELNSRQRFTHGTFTARMRMPATPAVGVWPAFWLVNVRNDGETPQEIDVAEWLGNQPTKIRCNYIWGYTDPQQQTTSTLDLGVDLSADWHDYSVAWSTTGLVWLVDGRIVKAWTANDAATAGVTLPDAQLMVIVNNAAGKPGGLAGTPDVTTHLPATLNVQAITVTT